MTGAEMKAAREKLDLSLYALGVALGYEGNRNTIQVAIGRYESGERDIPPWIGRLVEMYTNHGVPPQWLPQLGLTAAQMMERAAAFAALTTEQIRAAFAEAEVATKSLDRNGNVFNLIRAGAIDAAVGTLKAGKSASGQKDDRRRLRKALRAYVPHL